MELEMTQQRLKEISILNQENVKPIGIEKTEHQLIRERNQGKNA